MEGEDDETEEEAVDRIRGEISDRYDTDMQVISQLQVIRSCRQVHSTTLNTISNVKLRNSFCSGCYGVTRFFQQFCGIP